METNCNLVVECHLTLPPFPAWVLFSATSSLAQFLKVQQIITTKWDHDRAGEDSQSEAVFYTSMTLEVILKYHDIRSPHPVHVSDSLVVSVGGPQDCCFSAVPHLHSWDEATQASGTWQAVHQVWRSTPSTTTNTNKTNITPFCRFSIKKFLTVGTLTSWWQNIYLVGINPVQIFMQLIWGLVQLQFW